MTEPKPMTRHINTRNGSTSLETVISISILFLLVIVGVLIFLQQSRFDEKYFNSSITQTGIKAETASPAEKSLEIKVTLPKGYSPMSDQESFDQISLSDKIDGKAEGYLAAGFKSLNCRRFVNDSNTNRWFEFYLYDMGLPRNAFSIYSSQKREGVTPLDFTKFAYSTENALFFAYGSLYVEVISGIKDEALIKELIVMSKGFIEKQPADNAELPELNLLPSENLDTGSISLLSKNGFGYEKFDNIITAVYQVDGKKITAFLSIRETPENAAALSKGYDDTLSEFVGKERIKPETDQIPGLIIADVFDEYEFVFTKDNIIAGIHSAPDKKLGEKLAVSLYKKIIGSKNESGKKQ
jgi:hypothetical protein